MEILLWLIIPLALFGFLADDGVRSFIGAASLMLFACVMLLRWPIVIILLIIIAF